MEDITPKHNMTTVPVALTINGEKHSLDVAPWTTLVDLLRETCI